MYVDLRKGTSAPILLRTPLWGVAQSRLLPALYAGTNVELDLCNSDFAVGYRNYKDMILNSLVSALVYSTLVWVRDI